MILALALGGAAATFRGSEERQRRAIRVGSRPGVVFGVSASVLRVTIGDGSWRQCGGGDARRGGGRIG
jgi:hypothetical protein